MKKFNLKITSLIIIAIIISCFCGIQLFENYSDDALIIDNVEALTRGDSSNGEYTGYAKDYEIGRSLYITEITGEVGGEITVGMRISSNLAVQLSGLIVAEMQDEWKMTCQPNMGCYTKCSDEDWHAGTRTAELLRGC